MTDLQSKTGTYFRKEAWEGDGGGREMVGGGRWGGEEEGSTHCGKEGTTDRE